MFVPSPDVNLRDGYARTVKLLEGLTIGVAFVVLGSMFLWGCAPPNQCSKFGSDDSQEELDEEEPFLNHMLYPLAKPYNNTPLQPSITPTSQGPSTWDSVEAFQESPQETSALTGVPRAEPAKGGLGGRERSSDCALTEQHKGEARPGKETSSLRNVSLEMGTELCGGAGKTPLHLEVARGNLVKVKSITKYAAKMGIIDSVIGARDELGRTPLHSAASMGDEACVRIMLSQLTFPKSGSNFRDMLQGRSILPGVSEGDTRSLASYINDQDSAGNTMLHLAAAKGHSGVIRALQDLAREGGQHLNDALRNAGGLTPLQVAAINGRVKAVSQLLTTRTAVELQEDVNSDSEEEALEDAPSHKQSRQTIPLASTAGPDPETSVSRHSALHLAAMYGHVRVVRALLKYLANGALDMTLDGFMALNQAEAWEQEGSWAWQRSKVDL